IYCFLRMCFFGFRNEREGYGYFLDDLIRRLDGLAEVATVPGRVYSPSTRHRREDLNYPWLVFLLSVVPNDPRNEIRAIEEILDPKVIVDADEVAVRTLISQLVRIKESLARTEDGYLERGLKEIRPESDFGSAIVSLTTVLESAI